MNPNFRCQEVDGYGEKKTGGKGNNPNSQKNLIAGRNNKNAISTSLTLSQEARKSISKIGGGNMSRGVESMSEIISDAKLAIECLMSGHPAGRELGEAVLFKLEEVEIEQAYKNIKGELPKPGAYII